jgi:hypothetical protein
MTTMHTEQCGGGGWITTSLLTSYTKLDKLNWSCLKLLNENKQDLALDRTEIATPKEILQMQSADILAIAICGHSCNSHHRYSYIKKTTALLCNTLRSSIELYLFKTVPN